jgi:hypothetical protein
MLLGVMLLPAGKRKAALGAAVAAMFNQDFASRVLAFDSAAAAEFASLVAARRSAGRPIAQADAQIAAIAKSRGATLATRNGSDFSGCGVALVDPWVEGA